MDWGVLASIASFVMMVITVAGMLRSSGRTRAEELQRLRDEYRDRLDAHCRDDREKRKAIYEEMEKKLKDVENGFVRREMCEVLHGALKEGIDGVRTDIRRLSEMDGG